VKADGNDFDSYVFSLFITPIVCYSKKSDWILERVLPTMFVPNGSGLLVLKN